MPCPCAADKNQDNLELAEERFKEIQNAYEILIDPHERAWCACLLAGRFLLADLLHRFCAPRSAELVCASACMVSLGNACRARDSRYRVKLLPALPPCPTQNLLCVLP